MRIFSTQRKLMMIAASMIRICSFEKFMLDACESIFLESNSNVNLCNCNYYANLRRSIILWFDYFRFDCSFIRYYHYVFYYSIVGIFWVFKPLSDERYMVVNQMNKKRIATIEVYYMHYTVWIRCSFGQ